MSTTPDRAPDERPPADAPPHDDPSEDTIADDSEVGEALLETFPASDAPGYTGGAATPSDYEDPEDKEEA